MSTFISSVSRIFKSRWVSLRLKGAFLSLVQRECHSIFSHQPWRKKAFVLACKQLLCFAHGQDQISEQKPTTKNFDGFHNHSPLFIMDQSWKKGLEKAPLRAVPTMRTRSLHHVGHILSARRMLRVTLTQSTKLPKTRQKWKQNDSPVTKLNEPVLKPGIPE